MDLLVDAFEIGGLILIFIGFGLWRAKSAAGPVVVWTATSGLAILAVGVGFQIHKSLLAKSSAPPVVADITRPIITVTADIGGDVIQGPDGNYIARVQLTLTNIGTAPANAVAVIRPILETNALKDVRGRMLGAARKIGVSGGDSVFAGQPERGPIEEVSIPAAAVKMMALPGGGYHVTLPPLLVIATYTPLVRRTFYQTSYVIRLSGTSPPASPDSVVLLPRERIALTRMP